MKNLANSVAQSRVNAPLHAARCFGLRRSALLETGLFLAVALLVDLWLLDGTRFWGIAPHPFWLLVVLISVQYGTREGLVSAVAASCVLLAGNLPEQAAAAGPYDYIIDIAATPLMWSLAAIIFGELRVRQLRERERLHAQLDEMQCREELIGQAHQRLCESKEKLEIRLAAQMRSVMTAYQAAKGVGTLDPAEVLRGVIGVFRTALNPEKFSLFLLENGSLRLTLQEGWDDKDIYSRVIHPESQVYREVVGRQRVLCCARDEDESLLAGEGMLAGPLVCAHSGELLGMLKVEALGFADLNWSAVDAFRALCEWLGTTYANARRFQAARAESLYSSETNLYSYTFFERQTEFMTGLAERFGFDLSLLVLRLENRNELDAEQQGRVPALLSRNVRRELRRTDLVFDYQRTGSEFAFVLPGNSVENTQVLVDKILRNLKHEVQSARISATTLELHRAHPEVGPFVQEIPLLRRVAAIHAVSQ